MPLRDKIIIEHVMQLVQDAWPEDQDQLEPRWFDIISKSRGWLPMDAGDRMTVTVDGEMFQVKRIR